MFKKNYFFLALLLIYLGFLMEDRLWALNNNLDILQTKGEDIKNNFYQEEYYRLNNILKLENKDYTITYSKLIKRNIYEFYQKITILKGSKDNILKGDLVINEQGLVGIVTKVFSNHSEIDLITNNKTNLSVKINNSYGILTAKDNKLIVKNIKLNQDITEGEEVFTSGLTLKKEGILIGNVQNITKDNLELEYLIEVKPIVNFNNLNYVGVVK